MREIKFRGKGKDNGEWVYGYFIKDINEGDKCIIKNYSGAWWYVDCNSVSQYTGLKDENSTEIYEGDIVVVHGFTFDNGKTFLARGIVYYDSNDACFDIKLNDGNIIDFAMLKSANFFVEVVGNIYENLDLLKEVVECQE